MISKLVPLVPLLLAASLFATGCGDDDGVTPVCPTTDDCVTKPGKPPAREKDAGDEVDEEGEEGEGEELGEES